MAFQKKPNSVRGESVNTTLLATAEVYADRMLAREMRGPGDKEGALERIAARYGIAPNTFEHVRARRAKDIKGSIFARFRAAYLDMCERQVNLLTEEIKIEKAIRGDDSVEDLMAEARALAERIAAQKAGAA